MTAVLTAPPQTRTAPAATLTAHDRCDRCGAQVRVRVLIRMGQGRHALRLPLDFCNHHYNEHSIALNRIGAEIVAYLPVEGKSEVYL